MSGLARTLATVCILAAASVVAVASVVAAPAHAQDAGVGRAAPTPAPPATQPDRPVGRTPARPAQQTGTAATQPDRPVGRTPAQTTQGTGAAATQPDRPIGPRPFPAPPGPQPDTDTDPDPDTDPEPTPPGQATDELDAGAGPALDAGIATDAGPGALDEGVAEGAGDAGTTVAPAPATPGPDPAEGEPAAPPVIPVPVPAVDPGLFEGLLPGLPQGGPWTALGLLGVLAAAFLVYRLGRRLRAALPETGAIPWLVELLLTLVRLGMLVVVVALVARLLPASLTPALSWALLAAAAAVGWSARDVMPDVVAGLVILFERRIRRGVWVSVAEHAGIVETRGLRAVWLRDVLGHRVAVPNRLLLANAVVSEPGGAVHEVSLRLAVPDCPATRLRQALHDAVLTSPWAQPEAGSVVRRDGHDPEMWHVRARLIDVRFAMSFEGDLLERAEEMLAPELARARATADDDWD